jgi:hypothetical protein
MALGAIFVYAAWPKIYDPPSFAHLIWNYQILPSILINPMAIVLPWVEIICGLALIAGIYRRGAALLIGCMLVVFTVALVTDIIRDIPVNCGCFSVTPVVRSHGELIAEMKIDALRDLGMLVMALQALFTRTTWRVPEST